MWKKEFFVKERKSTTHRLATVEDQKRTDQFTASVKKVETGSKNTQGESLYNYSNANNWRSLTSASKDLRDKHYLLRGKGKGENITRKNRGGFRLFLGVTSRSAALAGALGGGTR